MFSTLEFILTYHVYCSHDESKYPLMLNNPNPNSITIKNGILGYTFLDCNRETTQTMSVIDNVAVIDFVKAFDSELNNDMHVCSTEPYIYSLTEIDSRNNLSEMAVSQNELATDFSNEIKFLQPRMPNWRVIPNENKVMKHSFLSSVLLNKHS